MNWMGVIKFVQIDLDGIEVKDNPHLPGEKQVIEKPWVWVLPSTSLKGRVSWDALQLVK